MSTQGYGKHEYKRHKNGRGIEVYSCRQCGCEMNDLLTKFQKPEVCSNCSKENRRLKSRLSYHKRKIGVK